MSETVSEAMIEGRGVTKVFKDFWGRSRVTAVSDVDITVRRGQVFGLLGPNGAGKSTLIKMILGHLYPTSGQLKVLGCTPRDVTFKGRLGYLPERAAFYRNLTAEEVLLLFGRVLDIPEPTLKKRVEQLLDMVGMKHARRRQVQEFSHGMGRRLGLAQSLLNDPDLVLLDEPTAGLDPIGCHEVKQLIATLAARGKTVLMSSHLLADVQDVCDTILIIYGGIVRECGAVDDLLARHEELQIRTPTVSQAVLDEARSVLAREVPADEISISAPRRTLEDYFLDVVSTASASEVETSGARMGSGVAEYLREDVDTAALLHELSRPDDLLSPEALPEEAAAPALDTNALAELTGPATPPSVVPPSDAADLGGRSVDADRLDGLTDKSS